MMTGQTQRKGVVVPFPDLPPTSARRALSGDKPRGEILLFTGIRYERLSEPAPEPSRPSSEGRKRRRRS